VDPRVICYVLDARHASPTLQAGAKIASYSRGSALAQTTDTGAIARFGEFEVDSRQASVRRNGTPVAIVAIQEKPLQLLLSTECWQNEKE
jgi:hypothetical protein